MMAHERPETITSLSGADFEAGLPADRLPMTELAGRLSTFLMAEVERANPGELALTMTVGGFDPSERFGPT
jgi:hypothetical protein